MPMTLRSRQAKWSTVSMPTSRWMRHAIARADIRADARGPSGMLMASMPKWCSRRAFATSFAADTPGATPVRPA